MHFIIIVYIHVQLNMRSERTVLSFFNKIKLTRKCISEFVKHYAPNHMLAPKENIYDLGKSQIRDIIHQLCLEFIQNLFRSFIHWTQTVCQKA